MAKKDIPNLDLTPDEEPIEAPQSEESPKEAKRKPDQELQAMGRIGRILDTLPDHCRGRVAAWVYSRFMSNNGRIFPNCNGD